MNESTQVQYRRAKPWQLVLAPAIGCVPTLFIIQMTFASYAATGIYGVATVLAGTIITGSRVFDAITDPIIGLLSDRLNSRFGRARPLSLLGYLITSLSILAMFKFSLGGGENGLIPFILIYAMYVVGYTIFAVGANLIGPILTNDPKQRPSFSRWQTVYATVLSSTISIVLAATLMPKHNYQMGPALFADLSVMVVVAAGVLVLISVITVTIAGSDVPESYVGAKKEPVSFKDMLDILAHNRPFQMYIVAAASDKLALQTASQSAISVMVFGIVIGNYSFNAQLTFVNMFVTLALLLFAVSRMAGNSGMKKALRLWTSVSIVTYAAMWVFMLSVDTLQITVNPVLKYTFIVLFCAMSAAKMACTCVTDPVRYDVIDYELSRSGRYMPAVVNTAYSFIDKLISSLGATIVATAVAMIGYTSSMPQATDTLTDGVFHVAMFLWLGMPILGWVCTLIALHFYKLDKETMVEVQKKNAEIRANSAAAK